MKTRSPLFWTTFAAGCVAGCLVSALLQPEFVVAKPNVTDGQKFEELHERLLAVERKTSPFVVDEIGNLSVTAPTEFKKSTKAVELLVCSPEADAAHPAFKVCGPAEFENGPTRFTGDSGSEPMIIVVPVMLRPRPDMLIKGSVAIEDASGKVAVNPYGIELLRGTPEGDPEVVSEWYLDVDGLSYFSVDNGTFDEAAANEFTELGGGGGDPGHVEP
jgi:hypothetical protein